MNKKIITVLAAALTLGLTGVSVQAAADLEIVTSSDGYIFRVSGKNDSQRAGTKVNVLVFNPGYSFDNKGEQGALQYQEETETLENGTFSIDIPIYMDGENDTGIYKTYISGQDMETVTIDAFAASDEDVKSAIEALKNAKSAEVGTVISANADVLSLSGKEYDALSKSGLYSIIAENKDNQEFLDEEDIPGTLYRLKRLMIVECYNQGLISLVYANESFNYSDYIDFSEIDKDGVNLYEIYEDIIKDKSAFAKSLLKGDCKNAEDLLKLFGEKAFIYGIADPKESGTANVSEVMIKKNAEYVGIDISNYENKSSSTKSKIAQKLVQNKYKTLDEIEKFIDDYKETTGGGGNGGGSNSSSSSSVSAGVSITMTPGVGVTEEKTVPFVDIENVSWAHDAIVELYNSGIVTGVDKTHFNPMGTVTREQFVVMMMRAIRTSEYDDVNFTDVLPGSYYAGYVGIAAKEGIVNGVGENKFGVGMPVKRQDIAVIIKNTFNYLNVNPTASKQVEFADSVDEYAEEAVDLLAGLGVINGFEDNTFRGGESCTRAQAAKLIYEALKLMQ